MTSAAKHTAVQNLPVHLRRACSCMSGDGGFGPWLDDRFGAGKWILSEYPRTGYERILSSHEFSELAVEYGHAKLVETFAKAEGTTLARCSSQVEEG